MPTVALPPDAANSTIADVGGIDASATSVTVATGEGARFGSSLPLDAGFGDATRELVTITGRAGDTLTIARHAYGTSAAAHAQGVAIAAILTAESVLKLTNELAAQQRAAACI